MAPKKKGGKKGKKGKKEEDWGLLVKTKFVTLEVWRAGSRAAFWFALSSHRVHIPSSRYETPTGRACASRT